MHLLQTTYVIEDTRFITNLRVDQDNSARYSTEDPLEEPNLNFSETDSLKYAVYDWNIEWVTRSPNLSG